MASNIVQYILQLLFEMHNLSFLSRPFLLQLYGSALYGKYFFPLYTKTYIFSAPQVSNM